MCKLQVRDGNSNGNLLGKFCGTSTPDPVATTSNTMWIKYRTDFSVGGRGFHAFYNSCKLYSEVWPTLELTTSLNNESVLIAKQK